MQEQNKKKKIDLKHMLKNNGYMLSLILKSCPGVFILTMITSVIGALQSFLFGTYLYQYALNALQTGEELSVIITTLACMFAFSVVYSIFMCICDCYQRLKMPVVNTYIQNLLHAKAATVDLSCFENSDFYDTYVKAMEGTLDKAYAVMRNISGIVWVIVDILAVGAVIVTIDPIFLAFVFLPLVCTLLVGKRRNRTRYDYNMESSEAARRRDYVRRTFYLADFSKEMRLTSMWKVMGKRMTESVAEMKSIVEKYGYKLMFFSYLFDLVFSVAVDTGTIIVAAYKTLVSKNMLLGDCFVVINSISNMAYSVNYMGNVVLRLDESALYADNLRAFLEYEVKISENKSAPSVTEFSSLSLRGVTFSYNEEKVPALSDVSIHINAGEKIAVVGHNGAGKTTLIKLLLRLYDPSGGEILLNGEPVKNYRLSSYRQLFGTVFQDYRLFAATVAENVMLRGNITEDDRKKVKDALHSAGIAERINALPKGIDTTVTKEFDEDGVIFSGGEAQKLSIARIFAGSHEIIIMDEPTSALDPIAEAEMYRNMFEACKGKTVIFISHRLSSATMADRIYMFEQGKVIEEGHHSELLARNGKYADMWHKQADTYQDSRLYSEEVSV